MDKILVHKAEKIDGERVMEIEIYLNFIGKVELPAQELTEEELAEIKEKQRLRDTGIFPTAEEVKEKYAI